jgi:hypothetical protein
MRKLSLIIIVVLAFVFISARLMTPSPHGDKLKVSCDVCHSAKGWKLDREIYSFDHSTTALPLTGKHKLTNCRLCHPTLVFSDAKPACADCHTDLHEQTVGPDCGRCHTTDYWIVNNITEIHQRSRFPLLGPHVMADCSGCHKSSSLLRFDPLGIECFDCHQDDYNATTQPNHIQGGYSKNCLECHSINSLTWTSSGIDHSFFPLSAGHAINDCSRCHTGGNFNNLSPECLSCHQADYDATTNPNHIQAQFPISCTQCHTTNPGWKPADFQSHDAQYFPIYSGKHQGEWNACTECHTQSGNFKVFSCIDCHEHNKTDMDDEHSGVGGYSYNSLACYQCHPTGSVQGSFNHNNSGFPLTGAHVSTPCLQCHTNGFSGTTTICSECHGTAYSQTTNPNHTAIGVPSTCADCHTTNPGWKPATFAIHNNYYVLAGAHVSIANNCVSCHNGNYNSTPNTCVGCYQQDYNQTTNPPHASAQFPTDCASCHTQNVWVPSTFNHDGQYFPIYSGKHQGEWNLCSDCHTTPTNYGLFSCIDCHEHNQIDMNSEHNGVSGYTYNSLACYQCHPTGNAGKMMMKSIDNTRKQD